MREKWIQNELLSDHHVLVRILAEIVEIDDVKNTFSVDFCLEIACDAITRQRDVPLDKRWVPSFSLFNTNNERLLSPHATFRRNNADQEVYVLNWLAEFRESLELYKFPFDRQFLHLSFEARNCTFELVDLDVGTYLPNWTLIKDITPKFSPSQKQCKLPIKLERRVSYYWWNVVFVLFILNLLAFTVVAIEPNAFSSRQSTSITLVLSGVAHKLNLNQLLPPIPYLTLMDFYTIGSFLLIAFMVLENFVIRFLYDSLGAAIAEQIDYIFVGILCGGWILTHFILFLLFETGVLRSSWAIVAKTQDKSQESNWSNPSLENEPKQPEQTKEEKKEEHFVKKE